MTKLWYTFVLTVAHTGTSVEALQFVRLHSCAIGIELIEGIHIA